MSDATIFLFFCENFAENNTVVYFVSVCCFCLFLSVDDVSSKILFGFFTESFFTDYANHASSTFRESGFKYHTIILKSKLL